MLVESRKRFAYNSIEQPAKRNAQMFEAQILHAQVCVLTHEEKVQLFPRNTTANGGM